MSSITELLLGASMGQVIVVPSAKQLDDELGFVALLWHPPRGAGQWKQKAGLYRECGRLHRRHLGLSLSC